MPILNIMIILSKKHIVNLILLLVVELAVPLSFQYIKTQQSNKETKYVSIELYYLGS